MAMRALLLLVSVGVLIWALGFPAAEFDHARLARAVDAHAGEVPALDRDDPLSGELLPLRVVDTRTGEGIANAACFSRSNPTSLLRPFRPFALNSPVVARSDATGRLHATAWYSGYLSAQTVLVTADGYESESVVLPFEPDGTEVLEVRRLEPLRALQGRVLDADGTAPGEGLELVVTAWMPNDLRASRITLGQADFGAGPTQFFAPIDADGRFGPLSLPRAELLTVHVHDTFTEFTSEEVALACVGPLEPLAVTLPKRATLRVRVDGGGRDVAVFGCGFADGPRLQIRTDGDRWESPYRARASSQRWTTLGSFLPGTVLLGLDLDEDEDWLFTRVHLEAGATHDRTLAAPVRRPIYGRAVYEDGEPLMDAEVSWSIGQDGRFTDAWTSTSADGSFELSGVLAESGVGRLIVVTEHPGVDPFRGIARPLPESRGIETTSGAYVSNGSDYRFGSVDGVSPGARVEVQVPRACVGLLEVHVRGGRGGDGRASLVRHDGRQPQASGEQWGRPLELGGEVLLSRHALEPGFYRVLIEEWSSGEWGAEADVLIEAGLGQRIELELTRTGILELIPPSGAIRAIAVELYRGDVRLAQLWLNPVVPTPLALAEGPITVEWELSRGAVHRETMRIVSDETISLALRE